MNNDPYDFTGRPSAYDAYILGVYEPDEWHDNPDDEPDDEPDEPPEQEPEHDPYFLGTHCRACGADLSRTGHYRDCENAPDNDIDDEPEQEQPPEICTECGLHVLTYGHTKACPHYEGLGHDPTPEPTYHRLPYRNGEGYRNEC